MMKETEKLIELLNHANVNVRLEALRELRKKVDGGEIQVPVRQRDVNNHIHTLYSFSPYSPAKAVWMAYMAGLVTSGIMDHDSVGGAEEFIEAGRIMGILTTVGVECRVKFADTALAGRRVNNPDQNGIVYMALHGIPHQFIDRVRTFFKPYTQQRNIRNEKMIAAMNELTGSYGINVDFDKDVVPLSMYNDGGSITERHLLFALAKKLIGKFGRGEGLVEFLKNDMKINVGQGVLELLSDAGEDNAFYEYDLLGALKSNFLEKIYIDADGECHHASEVIALGKEIGAISVYAYLGDVGNSVTGDKKAQKFEDDYLDELFDVIKGLGFNALTYMPSRNTLEQLGRVKRLCEEYGFLQISGEDINSPRQKFICQAQRLPEFSNLYDSTMALISHEIEATKDLNHAMFSEEIIVKYPDINDRIKYYVSILGGAIV